MGAKVKEIKEEVQFIKFIKNLYKDEIQFNFDEYFIVNSLNGEIKLCFPENKYYRLYGSLNINDADSFKNWLLEKDGSVKINNKELDNLRKLKLKYFLNIEKTENEYKINLDPESEMEFSLKKESPIQFEDNFKYVYQKEIPSNFLTDNSLFVVSVDDNNEIMFTNTCGKSNILFDSAIKNFKIIFKKDAKYTFYATDKDNDGYRVVMLEGKGNCCCLHQYFRVI